jgi:hypothetical protein
MIQFINNIIEWINTNIHSISAITTLFFVLFVFLNDKYDFTNEKCECGFKTDHLGTKAYWAWIKEQELLKQKESKQSEKEQSEKEQYQKEEQQLEDNQLEDQPLVDYQLEDLKIEQLIDSFIKTNPKYYEDYRSNEYCYIIAAGAVVGSSIKETRNHYKKCLNNSRKTRQLYKKLLTFQAKLNFNQKQINK